MHRGLVVQLHGFPHLRGIGRSNQIMNRAAIDRVARVPPAPTATSTLPSPLISCRDTYVVLRRQISRHDKSFPVAVAIPGELLFVGQQDIGFAVAVDVTDGDSVADGDVRIEHLPFESRRFGAESPAASAFARGG